MAVALIVAAGRGERLGAGRPKALVELAGRPMLDWSLRRSRTRAGDRADRRRAADRRRLARGSGERVIGVAGGATRSESVRARWRPPADGDPVLVHDAARPLLTPALVRPGARGAGGRRRRRRGDRRHAGDRHDQAVADDGGVLGRSTARACGRCRRRRSSAAPRSSARSRSRPTCSAHATDDAWLVERSGGRVVVASVSAENLKVTTPLDLAIAGELLSRRARGAASDPA